MRMSCSVNRTSDRTMDWLRFEHMKFEYINIFSRGMRMSCSVWANPIHRAIWGSNITLTETYKRDIQKRHTKETHKRDIQKRPTANPSCDLRFEHYVNRDKETYKRDIQKRHTKETYKRDLQPIHRAIWGSNITSKENYYCRKRHESSTNICIYTLLDEPIHRADWGSTNVSKETYKNDPQKRRTWETCKRDLQKRPTKKTYKTELQ